jgi:uncharacterized membrane protein YhfC
MVHLDFVYITRFLNSFLMIAMPLALALYLTRTWKLSWRYWLVGAAVFFFSQVGHIPFNSLVGSVLNKTDMVNWPQNAQTVFRAVFLGLSAGLFEELARYAMFRWWLKDARSWRKAVLAGAGHGGLEAIAVGLLAFYVFFQLSAYRNIDLATVIPAAQLELAKAQVTAYWSLEWYGTLLGAVERFLTIPVQITFSVIVLQVFTRKQGYWLWLAVFYHAVIDATGILLAPRLPVLLIEAVIACFTLFSLFVLFKLRSDEPVEELAPVAVIPAPAKPALSTPQETEENLDNTMYQ